MQQIEITIPNHLGLHTRAAAKLVDCAARFQSEIQLKRADKKADAKRIMAVMMLGAKYQDQVLLTVEGIDEVDAFAACLNLIKEGFGELAGQQ